MARVVRVPRLLPPGGGTPTREGREFGVSSRLQRGTAPGVTHDPVANGCGQGVAMEKALGENATVGVGLKKTDERSGSGL